MSGGGSSGGGFESYLPIAAALAATVMTDGAAAPWLEESLAGTALEGAGATIAGGGIGALTGDTTAAAQAGLEREKKLAEQYTPTFQPEKIVKPFEEGRYGEAAIEAVKGVPGAIGQLAPSVVQELGLAGAGRLLGGALGAVGGPGGAAVGSQIGQYAVPFVVNAIQALGAEAQQKAQAQKEAGEKPDVNALELAPYASLNAEIGRAHV